MGWSFERRGVLKGVLKEGLARSLFKVGVTDLHCSNHR